MQQVLIYQILLKKVIYHTKLLEWFIDFDKRSQDLNGDFTVKDCFFGAVKLTKKADADK